MARLLLSLSESKDRPPTPSIGSNTYLHEIPHETRMLEVIDRLPGARVGVVGDLVADVYVSGLSERVSREAPVLIVRYEKQWLRPGGAANVAANVAALGATAHVVGLVGDDASGRDLIKTLTGSAGDGRVDCDHVVVAPGRPTITKTRFLAGAKLTSRQQVFRLDRDPTASPGSEVLAELSARITAIDARVDAWVVSDYGYGVFDDSLCEQFRAIADRKCVLADSRWALERFMGVTAVKPNEQEAVDLARRLGFSWKDESQLAQTLADRLQVRAVVMTLGREGMVLAENGRTLRIPAWGTEEIVDLTGAGDTVAATLAAALSSGADVESASRLANVAGGVVVMKEGAATVPPHELRAAVQRQAGNATGGRT